VYDEEEIVVCIYLCVMCMRVLCNDSKLLFSLFHDSIIASFLSLPIIMESSQKAPEA